MNILQFNVRLAEGGAAGVALDLHQRALQQGLASHFVYGYGKGGKESVSHQNYPQVIKHLVASGTTTWYDYAALVFEEARKAGIPLALNKLNAVPTTAYPTPARRPHNSRLNTEKFQQNFALVLPDWQVGVKRMLNELFTTIAI